MHHPLWVTPNLNFFFTSIKIIPVASTLLFVQIQQAWSWGVQYFKFRNSCGIVRPSCSRANHTTACKHHSTLNKVNGFFIFRNSCGFKSSVLIPASNDFRSQFDLLNISFTPFFWSLETFLKGATGNVWYSETLNNEYIGRNYQMSSWQFFNGFYTILRKFQYLRK